MASVITKLGRSRFMNYILYHNATSFLFHSQGETFTETAQEIA